MHRQLLLNCTVRRVFDMNPHNQTQRQPIPFCVCSMTPKMARMQQGMMNLFGFGVRFLQQDGAYEYSHADTGLRFQVCVCVTVCVYVCVCVSARLYTDNSRGTAKPDGVCVQSESVSDAAGHGWGGRSGRLGGTCIHA